MTSHPSHSDPLVGSCLHLPLIDLATSDWSRGWFVTQAGPNGGPSLGFWTWKGRECQSVLLSGGGYETRGPGLISCQQQGGSSAGRRNKLTRGRDEEHVLLQFKCLFSVTLVHSCSSGYSMDCSLMVVGTVTNSHSSSPSSRPRYMTAVFAFCKKMR